MRCSVKLRNDCHLPQASLKQVGLLVSVVAYVIIGQPAIAQKLHAYEPSMMDPHATIYVNDGSCSSGKVLKVRGALKNHRRKKSCVPLSDVPAGAAPSQLRK
jgi:hypothetical protein